MPVPHFFVEHDTLLHLCVCCSQVALAKRQLAQETLGCSDAFLEAHLLGQCEAFLHKGTDARLVSLAIKERLGQLRERVGNAPLVAELSVYCHALLVQRASPGVLTLTTGHKSQGEERIGHVLPMIHLPKECQRRLGDITSHPGNVPQPIEGECNAIVVSESPVQCQALFTQHLCLRIVALDEGQVCGSHECLCTHRWIDPGTRKGSRSG